MRILLGFVLLVPLVFGASPPTAPPEQAGFSRDRLDRINTVMRELIAAGRLRGASGLISRNGKVVFRETWGDYQPDTIVRMYSMTRAFTCVAAMILYEEGKFSLTDPIKRMQFSIVTVSVTHFTAALLQSPWRQRRTPYLPCASARRNPSA
jgi:CubicO group peptidase (beta-lactamase class C family)